MSMVWSKWEEWVTMSLEVLEFETIQKPAPTAFQVYNPPTEQSNSKI